AAGTQPERGERGAGERHRQRGEEAGRTAPREKRAADRRGLRARSRTQRDNTATALISTM
ncbi:hypothetical protein KGP93_28700, partial [Burkholderia multivorans]|nr:hypothetical protein [Burkholderia multivorans]